MKTPVSARPNHTGTKWILHGSLGFKPPDQHWTTRTQLDKSSAEVNISATDLVDRLKYLPNKPIYLGILPTCGQNLYKSCAVQKPANLVFISFNQKFWSLTIFVFYQWEIQMGEKSTLSEGESIHYLTTVKSKLTYPERADPLKILTWEERKLNQFCVWGRSRFLCSI